MSELVSERGSQYGAPAEHFARTTAILAIVFGDKPMSELRPQDWPVVMVCDKLARFAETLDHPDSIADIGGYSETWFMAREPSVDLCERLGYGPELLEAEGGGV